MYIWLIIIFFFGLGGNILFKLGPALKIFSESIIPLF